MAFFQGTQEALGFTSWCRFFRVRVAFFQGTQEALGFTSLWGKMRLKGAMTSSFLVVLLAAILKSGASRLIQNRLDYYY